MTDIYITTHAIERYQERVQACSDDCARKALSSPTIALAAKFGAPYVRLSGGQYVVIKKRPMDWAIITVLPKYAPKAAMATDTDYWD